MDMKVRNKKRKNAKLFQTAQMESEISTKSLNKIHVIIEMRSTQLKKKPSI